ncbi:HDOD domain-containing protein [Candidatus Solirubrobacter pratensis]|uniref:HDOD domain-containing protein n=1 Tax=Candidatus Solirubrobacter pratensis TaxID=1298857 RepID=UPI000687763F|nr:HDOD domain-containing protein [Candidatus Solirubrobacter pratensis]
MIDRLPALLESKERLYAVVRHRGPARDLVAAVEADPALTLTVLGIANQAAVGDAITSVREAVKAVADDRRGAEFVAAAERWDHGAERLRVHALAVQRLAGLVADRAGRHDSDAVIAAAALHDLGKVALGALTEGHRAGVDRQATPEEGVRRERRHFGVDHAALGGTLARSWKLPDVLCEAIDGHHDERPEGVAAVVSVADMLAHFAAADPIDVQRLADVGDRAGLSGEALSTLLHEQPYPMLVHSDFAERCPLSERELRVVRGLRAGKGGKQIALELGISESTVRSHLHRIYRRLGVADRAQAVLAASARGWV